MERPLAYYGASVLRKKAEEIAEITDEIRQLVVDMTDTMRVNNGIGLAGPQVHQSIRLFITLVPIHEHNEETGQDRWLPGKLKVYINPVLSNPSEETWTQTEGCLSIPKTYGDVTRPYRITVEATDLEGNRFTEELEGLEARCVMHENDHINGVLFFDRLSAPEKKALQPQLKKLKKYHSN